MRVALVLEYEGTRYHGFQYQDNAASVQAELEQAILRLTGERTRVKAASRTDTGVHAVGQVVAFDTQSGHSPEGLQRGLNAYLPDDVAVRQISGARDNFDPRREALSRRYRYTMLNQSAPSPLWRRFAHRVPGRLDEEAMHRAAQTLLGRHDVRAFSGPLEPRATSVRWLMCAKVWRQEALVYLEVTANAFLPHQMRRTAGALMRVGRGNLSEEEFAAYIDSKEPVEAGPTLPPQGLCLVEVTYADSLPKDEIDATNL